MIYPLLYDYILNAKVNLFATIFIIKMVFFYMYQNKPYKKIEMRQNKEMRQIRITSNKKVKAKMSWILRLGHEIHIGE